METEGFEFRVLPKTFQASSTTISTDRRSPRLRKKLEKLREHNSKKANVGKLVENYRAGLGGVRGRSLDDSDTLKRQKDKYYTNFSCSKSTLPEQQLTIQAKENHDRMTAANLSREVTMDWSTKNGKPGHESRRRTSCSSDRGDSRPTFWPIFNEEFFNSLNVPGHFNTRGIYGQKAKVAPLSLTRSRTDLSMDQFDFLKSNRPKKQNTMFTSLNSTPRYEAVMIPSERPKLQLSKLSQLKGHSRAINTDKSYNDMPKPTTKKATPQPVTEAIVTKKTPRKEVKEIIQSSSINLRTARKSVDATTQTDLDDETFMVDGIIEQHSDHIVVFDGPKT